MIPAHLAKIRDEGAAAKYYPRDREIYSAGFDACADILLKEIEEYRAALEREWKSK